MAIVIIPSTKYPGKIIVATGTPGPEYYTIEKAEILVQELQLAIKRAKEQKYEITL
jgi:hypothetical protein